MEFDKSFKCIATSFEVGDDYAISLSAVTDIRDMGIGNGAGILLYVAS
jgi:hypothetical protein